MSQQDSYPEPAPGDGPAPQEESRGYLRQPTVDVNVGADEIEDEAGTSQEEAQTVGPSIVVSPRTRQHVTQAVARVFQDRDQLPPDDHEALVRKLCEGLSPAEEEATSEGLRFLVENVARTVERTAAGAEDGTREKRMAMAARLHHLAQEGGREGVAQSLKALREMIHDITALRQKVNLLEDTTASAYSALNNTEHDLAELRAGNERLLAAIASSAERCAAESDSGLTDQQASVDARIGAAETVLSAVATQLSEAASGGGATDDEVDALRERLARLEDEAERLRSDNAALEEVRWARDAAMQEVSELRAQLAAAQESDGDASVLSELRAQCEEATQRAQALESEKAALDQRMVELAADHDAQTSEKDELIARIAELESVGAAASVAAAEVDSLRTTNSELEQQLASTRQQAEASATAQSESDAALASSREELTRRDEHIAELEQQLVAAHAATDAVREEAEAVRAQQAAVSAGAERVDDLERELASARAEIEGLRTECETLRGEHAGAADVAAKLGDAHAQIQRMQEEQSQLEDRVREVVIERDSLKAQVKARIAQVEEVGGASDALQHEIDERIEEVARLRHDLGDLRDQLDTSLALAEESSGKLKAREQELEEANLALGSVRGELEQARERFAAVEEERSALAERLAASAANGDERERDAVEYRERLAERERAIEQVEEDLGAARVAVQSATERGDALEAERDALDARARELEAQLERATGAGEEQQGELGAARERLATLAEELEQAREQLAEREQALEQARSDAARLQERLNLGAASSEELHSKAVELQQQLADRDTELEAARGIIEQREAEHGALQERYAELGEQAEAGRREIAELSAAVAERESERDAAREQLDTLACQAETLRERLEAVETAGDRARVQVESLERELRERQEACDLAEASAAELENQLEEARADAGVRGEELARSQARLAELEPELDRLRGELAGREDELGELRTRLAEVEQQHAEAQAALTATSEDLATTRADRDQAREAAAAGEETCDQLRAQIEDQEAQTAAFTSRTQAEIEERDNLVARLREAEAVAEQTITALHQQISQIEDERLQEARDYEGRLHTMGEEAAAAATRQQEADAALARLRETGRLLGEAGGALAASLSGWGGDWAAQLESVAPELDVAPMAAALASIDELAHELRDAGQAAAVGDPLATEGLAGRLEGAAERWRGAADVLDALGERQRELAERCKSAEHEAAVLGDRLTTSQAEAEDGRQQIAALEGDLEQQRTAAAAAASEAHELRGKLNASTQSVEQLREAVAAAQAETAEEHARLEQLEAKRAAEAAAAQRAAETSAAQQAGLEDALANGRSSEGQLRGCLERLGELLNESPLRQGPHADAVRELEGHLEELPGDPAQALRDGLGDDLAVSLRALVHDLAMERGELTAGIAAAQARGTELEAALAAEREAHDGTRSELESATAELAAVNDALSVLRVEHEQRGEENAEQARQLRELESERDRLGGELAAARGELDELRPLAARVEPLEHQLVTAREACSEETRRLARHREALEAVVQALKQLGLTANERFDAAGLELAADGLKFTRSTMRWTQQQAENDDPALTADYAGNLAGRIGGQLQAFGEELAATRRDRAELVERGRELESRVAELAQDREERDQSISDLRSRLEQLGEVRERCEAQATRIAELEAALESARAHQEQERRSAAASHEEFKASSEQALAEAETAREAAAAHGAELEQRLAGLVEELQEAESRLAAEQAGWRQEAQQHEEQLAQRDDQLARQASEIDQLRGQRLEAVGLQARITTLNEKLSAANKEIAQLKASAEAGRADHEAAQRLADQVKREQRQRDELSRKVRTLERQLGDERAQVTSMKKSRGKLQKDWQQRYDGLGDELTRALDKQEDLAEEGRRLRREIAGLKARLRSLEGG
ncbi:MAG: hypothetical protein ACOCYP_00820 [Planctomycetota bacterium]